MGATFDEAVRLKRRHRVLILVVGLVGFVPSRWPKLREAGEERDVLRLAGFAMLAGSSVPLAVADLRRAERAVTLERRIPREDHRWDVPIMVAGIALNGGVVLLATVQRVRADRDLGPRRA